MRHRRLWPVVLCALLVACQTPLPTGAPADPAAGGNPSAPSGPSSLRPIGTPHAYGRAVLPNGQPMAGAAVVLRRLDGRILATVTADDNGRFAIPLPGDVTGLRTQAIGEPDSAFYRVTASNALGELEAVISARQMQEAGDIAAALAAEQAAKAKADALKQQAESAKQAADKAQKTFEETTHQASVYENGRYVTLQFRVTLPQAVIDRRHQLLTGEPITEPLARNDLDVAYSTYLGELTAALSASTDAYQNAMKPIDEAIKTVITRNAQFAKEPQSETYSCGLFSTCTRTPARYTAAYNAVKAALADLETLVRQHMPPASVPAAERKDVGWDSAFKAFSDKALMYRSMGSSTAEETRLRTETGRVVDAATGGAQKLAEEARTLRDRYSVARNHVNFQPFLSAQAKWIAAETAWRQAERDYQAAVAHRQRLEADRDRNAEQDMAARQTALLIDAASTIVSNVMADKVAEFLQSSPGTATAAEREAALAQSIEALHHKLREHLTNGSSDMRVNSAIAAMVQDPGSAALQQLQDSLFNYDQAIRSALATTVETANTHIIANVADGGTFVQPKPVSAGSLTVTAPTITQGADGSLSYVAASGQTVTLKEGVPVTASPAPPPPVASGGGGGLPQVPVAATLTITDGDATPTQPVVLGSH